MREYKFRGKDKNTGKWVYGFYLEQDTYSMGSKNTKKDLLIKDAGVIVQNSKYDSGTVIDKETLGQYTGLKDKNGKEIYEGDILLAPEWFGTLKCVCIYQQENTVNPIQGFGLYSYDSYFKKYNTLVESDEWDEFKVIGNIYDNPELLEKG